MVSDTLLLALRLHFWGSQLCVFCDFFVATYACVGFMLVSSILPLQGPGVPRRVARVQRHRQRLLGRERLVGYHGCVIWLPV